MEDLFRSMDKNGDGMITLQEFLASSSKDSKNKELNRRIFELIDQNRDGALEFHEFITLVYLRASPRQRCDGCHHFIPGLFFTCTECWKKDDRDTFDLCTSCYHGRHFTHHHTDFMDNHSLLHITRNTKLSRSKVREFNS